MARDVAHFALVVTHDVPSMFCVLQIVEGNIGFVESGVCEVFLVLAVS